LQSQYKFAGFLVWFNTLSIPPHNPWVSLSLSKITYYRNGSAQASWICFQIDINWSARFKNSGTKLNN